MSGRSTTPGLYILAASAVAFAGLAPVAGSVNAAQSQAASFANSAFERTWQRTDLPVLRGLVSRSWSWGPQPGATSQEAAPGIPGGTHLVQYFDKARMEINSPSADPRSPWYVTSGLLTVEMVSGQIVGGTSTGPANTPLASDADDANAPTYASFSTVADVPGNSTHQAAPATGQPATATIDRAGKTGVDPSKAALGRAIQYAYFDPETHHNIVAAFWDFLNSTGLVYENGQTQRKPLSNPWFYATGFPISEAYWARVNIAGKPSDVLIQAFQRRVLTYVPSNPAGWKVQMGNIGQHYYQWRYGSTPVPQPQGTPGAKPGGRITFVSNRDSMFGVYTAAPDGSELRVVATTPGYNFGPKFNSGGQAIAYHNLPSSPFGRPPLFDPRLDPTARIMLTTDTKGAQGSPMGATTIPKWEGQADPVYSPNGLFLAFRGKPAGEPAGIFLANLASDAIVIPVRRLTTGDWDRQPAWNPGGKTIAFVTGSSESDSQLATINADGSGQRVLTTRVQGVSTIEPAWSPDGTRIAYATNASGGKYQIAITSALGTPGSVVIQGAGNQRHPAFSPDGGWLAFSSDKDGNSEVYISPADGSRWTDITNSPYQDSDPYWGP